MSKHTAGPWEWNHVDQLVAVNVMTPSFDDLDTDEDERKPVVIIETDGGFYPPRGPDRLLLAAAPDLLVALQKVMALNSPFTGNPSHADLVEFWQDEKEQGRGAADDMLEALAAIAKATGAAS